MLKKLNKFLNSSIAMAILMLLMGLIFIIFPKTSFETITYIIAVILIINGIYFIVEKNNTYLFPGFLSLGIIELLAGIVILINPNIVKTLFPILIFPSILLPHPINTLLPIVGCLLPFSFPVPPKVTPW